VERLIMFDYDGVIVDSFEYFYRACVRCFNRFGFTQYANRERIVAFNDANWFEALAVAGVPVNVRDAIEETYVEETSADGAGPKPFGGMCGVLRELGSRDTVIIITAARERVVQRFLADQDLDCVARVLGSDTETSKVRKIGIARAEFGEGLEPFYIGDTVGDIVEGKRSGVTTIAVTWGWQNLETLADASPDHLVQSPQELLELFVTLQP
jgi:phosphoglycolate phosphatase